jgi:hypothetical protein
MSTEYLNNKNFEAIIASFQRSKKRKSRFDLIVEDLQDMCNRKDVRGQTLPEDKSSLGLAVQGQQESHKHFKEAQSKLAMAFYLLSQNIVSYAKFDLIDDDDATQEGVMICFDKVDRFNSDRGKGFNYFTTCILNHFRQLYRTAKNYNELKRKYNQFMQIKLDQPLG